MYAVIDVETTGLRPGWHDRIVEIAIVHLDDHGNVNREWCSLVNPDRDMGPQSVHGISAAEARRAPTFDQLAGHVAELVRGRVIVAHNLSFDARFLAAEFERAGFKVPVDPADGLCTMSLASHFLPAAGRSLPACRRILGLPDHRAHSALHDALAAADLMAYYLAAAGSAPPWAQLVTEAAERHWPQVPRTSAEPVERVAAGHRQEHFLRRLVESLPRTREPKADSYLDLLDRALLDRHISDTEADALVSSAEELGLWQDDVVRLHQEYLCGLAVAALDDQVLTVDEHDDLTRVAQLLGLDETAVDAALATASGHDAAATRRDAWRLRSGDTVVFTGSMDPTRDWWEERARSVGLRVGANVTRKTRLTVAADPDSMSGKAKLARRYGVPIVHPSGYLRLVADLVAGK